MRAVAFSLSNVRWVPPAPPVSLSAAPVISGDATEGETLTLTPAVWVGAATTSQQWHRDGSPISGATGLTYVQTADDVGAMMTCVETAINGAGSVTATSNALGPVAAAVEGDALLLDSSDELDPPASLLLESGDEILT